MGHDTKGTFAKITTETDVKKLLEGYKKCTGSNLWVFKAPGDMVTTLNKSDLKHSDNINKYRSFMGKLMWYTTKVGPDVAIAARKLAVHMNIGSHWDF